MMAFQAYSTHIVGGGFALKHTVGSSYELTMNYLGDCLNGDPQAFNSDQGDMLVGIFDKATNIKKTQVQLSFISKNILAFATDSCAKTVPGCTELFVFKKTIVLDPKIYNNTAGYYISWERCCRNGVINNIVNPGGAAMVFYMEFPPVAFITNSSPYFTNNPNTLLCAEGDFIYNLNYKDDDNDQLRYSLVDPLNGNLNSKTNNNGGNPSPGPYKPIQWASGYSANNAILGSPSLSIDHFTGEISVTPNVIGLFIASIRVEEYRFGKKIGEVRLELQFNVGNCPNLPPSVITLNDTSTTNQDIAYFDIQIPKELCFRIKSNDTKDSIYLKVNSPIFTNDTITSYPTIDTISGGLLSINKKFCWKTDCSLQGIGRVPFYLTLKDNGCPSPRSSKKNVYVNVIDAPTISPTDILCLTLADNKTTIYWGDSTGNNPYFKQNNLYRGIDYKNWVLIDSISDKKLRNYTDNNTPNNKTTNYTYMMRAVNICGIEGPVSDTLSTFEQLVASPAVQKINYVTVTPDEKSIKITWPQTSERDFAKYYLYKSSTNKTYNLIKTYEWPYDTTYHDYAVMVDDSSYCYYVIMRDTCDNYSPYGQKSCSILLKGYSENFINTIWWNPYKTWETGVGSYDIWRNDPVTAYQKIATIDTIKTEYADSKLNIEEGMFSYFINAKENVANASTAISIGYESRSNDIQLRLSPIVYAPSAFSANGDNVNDSFKWTAVYTKDMNIKIFNRWGQLIYETNDKKAYWDGNVNGAPAPIDVYHYIIFYTGYEGTNNSINGNLTLIR